MSRPDDFESYQKGYEDAMRAAGQASLQRGVRGRARTGRRKLGEKVGESIGYAFGWLVLFPLFVGLFWGVVGWLSGGDFTDWALVWGGLAFLFSVFAGAAIVGWRLFIAYWPIVLVGVAVIVVVRQLLG